MSQLVLLVDDSPPIHALIKAHMSGEPWVFHSAYDGPSALRLAASLHPDVVLLDVDMPEMNGFDVCRAIKGNPETSRIAVIFLTASASMDEKICGLQLRAADYITKPFCPEELLARVRTALRTKRLLDLLPESSEEAERSTQGEEAAPKTQFNGRLSLKKMWRARSKNPWERKPPDEVTVADDESR